MNKKQFNKKMQISFNNFFGKMKLSGKRYSYPMITTYAKKFISNRFALIGDAAVGMHPVTAHGFNLGLYGSCQSIQFIQTAIDCDDLSATRSDWRNAWYLDSGVRPQYIFHDWPGLTDRTRCKKFNLIDRSNESREKKRIGYR